MLDSMISSWTTGGDLLTSQSPVLEHVRAWVVRSSIPLTLLFASAFLGSILQWSRRHHHHHHHHHQQQRTERGGEEEEGEGTAWPLPPSPGTALPLLGHLHLLKKGDPRETFRDLREKLGDIFSFYAGSRLIVVLNGYDVIREALVKKAAVFSHRPHTFMSQQMGQGRGIVNTSGRQWREQRQFAERALRSLMAGGESSAFLHKVKVEVHSLLELLEESRCQGRPVDPGPLLQASFSNVVISAVYGRRFELDDPKFISLMTALTNCFENFGNTEPLNFFPAVRFLPGDPYRYWFCIENMNVLESLLVYPEVLEHERKLDSAEESESESEPDDVISAYLREMTQKRSQGTPTFMDKENLIKVAGDFLAGGTEPPSTTVHWIVLYLVHFPHVQEKCYQELMAHVGDGRQPRLDDRGSLPYLEATILEVQRHADVGPFAMAHGVARDTRLRGYRVPRDAIVLVNVHSVHHDESADAWGGDPEVFRPERFLGEDGKVKRPERFMPYSLGPRICPGVQMARVEMFLYISTLLQRYRLAPHGATPPPLEGRMTLMHSPLPFLITLHERR
ncbi:cytochrome P450 2B4-like [Babylonia areolata]|uniref:cytochrome P450 2B4-like n=1 Tax=Babylonia areolata TaxID=304850 RepID=UPI003FD17597